MNTLDTALMWRDLGIATIPILARSKSPAIDKWKPYQSRLPSEFELRAWFSRPRPGYNIAVVTGWQGLVIVDWDNSTAHETWFSNLSEHYQDLAWTTYNVATRRGLHYYFYCRGVAAQCARLDGVDIKAAGGYCLAPPSIHPCGDAYDSMYSPDSIKRIHSVADILPEYQQAISRPRPRPSTLHPLDAAMLPHTSTTIEEANAKLSYEQLLGPNRGTRYICPFHDDHHPSLHVYRDGDWRCFVCGAYGDKLDLYANLNNMTIQEALCTL